jgi:hypothetical protein
MGKTKPIITSYRFPAEMILRLKQAVERLKPAIRSVNHAVEIAIYEWLERNEEKKP